jgi:hypothetical protein
MKIKTSVFLNFIQKAGMTDTVNNCMLNFSKDGLIIKTAATNKLAMIDALLKSTAFTEYEEIGKIGIDPLLDLKSILKRFKESIKIKVEGNVLILSEEGKKIEFPITDTQFIDAFPEPKNLEFHETFALPSEKVQEIIKDSMLNKDSYITIITEPGKVKLQNSGRYKFLHEYAVPTVEKETKSKFGDPFVKSTDALTGTLEFSTRTDYILKVVEKTDISLITVLIAPLITKDDGDEA